jgi:hypothetical protein
MKSLKIEEMGNPFKKKLPNPTQVDLSDPDFQAIWNIIKDWDINVPEYYRGYMSGSGSHVKLILDEIKRVRRDSKINQLLD